MSHPLSRAERRKARRLHGGDRTAKSPQWDEYKQGLKRALKKQLRREARLERSQDDPSCET